MAAVEADVAVKVVVVGSAGVGKTALVNCLTEKPFRETQPTLMQDLASKQFVLPDSRVVHCSLWDTAGQERYRGAGALYYRNAKAVAVVFDLAVRATFATLPRWLDEVREHAGGPLPIVVMGNKTDLEERRAVSVEEAEAEAAKIGAVAYYEVTAKRGDNVYLAFQRLVEAACPPLDDGGAPSASASESSENRVRYRRALSKDARPGAGGKRQYERRAPRSDADPMKVGQRTLATTDRNAVVQIGIEGGAGDGGGAGGRKRRKRPCCAK